MPRKYNKRFLLKLLEIPSCTMGFYYAVAKGRRPGIYRTWDECKEQVNKFSGPIYKKFSTVKEAQDFIDSRQSASKSSSASHSKNLVCIPTNVPNDLIALGNRGCYLDNKKRPREEEKDHDERNKVSRKRVQNSHFDMDEYGFVNVYTDGACSKNGQNGAKAGIGVYFAEGSPLNVSAPVMGRATNNMAEIQAVTRAATVAIEAGITKLRINTDSQFLIKCITEWMPGWKRRGWTTQSGAPVINKQELQEMESALKPLTVEWNHVRGHQGLHGNEMADSLAREGAKKYVNNT